MSRDRHRFRIVQDPPPRRPAHLSFGFALILVLVLAPLAGVGLAAVGAALEVRQQITAVLGR